MDLLGLAGAYGPDGVKCSRKGCVQQARVELLWNNPKVHDPQRLKSWVACGEHEQYLEDFLASRGFLRLSQPLEGDLQGG